MITSYPERVVVVECITGRGGRDVHDMRSDIECGAIGSSLDGI